MLIPPVLEVPFLDCPQFVISSFISIPLFRRHSILFAILLSSVQNFNKVPGNCCIFLKKSINFLPFIFWKSVLLSSTFLVQGFHQLLENIGLFLSGLTYLFRWPENFRLKNLLCQFQNFWQFYIIITKKHRIPSWLNNLQYKKPIVCSWFRKYGVALPLLTKVRKGSDPGLVEEDLPLL